MEQATIPRMRTAAKVVAELKAIDPGTDVSEYCIRQLVKSGELSVVWAGNKALINLDDVIALLHMGTSRPEPEIDREPGIRPVDEDLRICREGRKPIC